jgi:hypothetical protein
VGWTIQPVAVESHAYCCDVQNKCDSMKYTNPHTTSLTIVSVNAGENRCWETGGLISGYLARLTDRSFSWTVAQLTQ